MADHDRALLLAVQHQKRRDPGADQPHARWDATGRYPRPRGQDADFGLPSDAVLHTNYDSPTPNTVPGARTLRTPDLEKLLDDHKPLVLDTGRWGRSIPGAVGLWGSGIGGSLSDDYQGRLRRKMQQLTRGDRARPIVTLGFNAERYQGRNLALRLAALGYTSVYWYRGGREAWEAASSGDGTRLAAVVEPRSCAASG